MMHAEQGMRLDQSSERLLRGDPT